MKLKVSASWNDALIARVKLRMRDKGKAQHDHRIELGIPPEEADKPALGYDGKSTGATLGQVAWWNEFGTDTLPERSWFRSWFDANAERLRREMVVGMRSLDLVSLGTRWARELRAHVVSGEAHLAPDSLETQAAREHAGLEANPPLFATGQLVNAVRAMLDGGEIA